MDKIYIRGVCFDNVSLDEAVEKCSEMIADKSSTKVIHTPNAEIVELCVEKNEYYKLFNSAELIIPDGAGVILAGKILGTPLTKGRVPGIELFERIVSLSGINGWSVFLLGGKPGVADAAAEKLKEKYPDMILAGTNDGYFGSDSAPVIEKINASKADFLAVCLGVPKQEEWMNEHRGELNVPLMGGFGGSLDVFAGNVKRAPAVFRKLSCEWLYRLIKEPYRIGRMMKLPKFILGAIKDKIFHK